MLIISFEIPKGDGDLTIVNSGGDNINTTWEFNNNTITTLTYNASINSSKINEFANSNTLTITANTISIEDDLNVTTSGNGIVFKAKSDITVPSVITTTNGDITLWSDSDGDSSGRIGILNGGIVTGGGDISLVGGTSGDGYAVGNNNSITDFHNYRGIWINNSTLNANGTFSGGDIIINGKGYVSEITNDYNIGVDFVLGTVIKTNFNGRITVNGIGGPHSTSDHGAGINFHYENSVHTANGSLTLNGTAGGGSATNARLDAGINFDGGGTFDAKLYSTSGDITLKGTKSSLSNSYGIMNGEVNIHTYIGTDGTTKTSGNITIESDNFDFQESYHIIETSGTLSVKSISDSFTSAFDSDDIYISSTLSGLTIGTASNTTNITISEDIEVAGPISIHGGDITISNSLSSTLLNADIVLKASGDIEFDSNQSIHTNGGNIILWSNADNRSDGINNGYIYLKDGSEINSDGGHVWLSGGSGSQTWNSISVGDGYALGGELINSNHLYNVDTVPVSAGLYLEKVKILSNGGDIAL